MKNRGLWRKNQPWLKNLSANKSRGQLTLHDYQHAFESNWASFHVTKGSYTVNGITKKAPRWKQFKRLEYEIGIINDLIDTFKVHCEVKYESIANLSLLYENGLLNITLRGGAKGPTKYIDSIKVMKVVLAEYKNNLPFGEQ